MWDWPQRSENIYFHQNPCNFDSTKIRLIQSFVQALITKIVDFRSIQINRRGTTALSNDQLLLNFSPFFLLEGQALLFKPYTALNTLTSTKSAFISCRQCSKFALEIYTIMHG